MGVISVWEGACDLGPLLNMAVADRCVNSTHTYCICVPVVAFMLMKAAATVVRPSEWQVHMLSVLMSIEVV